MDGFVIHPRDSGHGKVKAGDILVIYFASNSIEFEGQIGKVYRVDSVSEDNVRFNISEIKELHGITLGVIKDAIQNGKIRNEVFNKVGQQGFNIIEIEKSDFDQLLSLDNAHTSEKLLNFVDLQKFILDKMQMQANYQPIMIRMLLVSGGKASKDDISTKIREHNPHNQEQDFKNIPVYDVLKKHGIVRREENYYNLNNSELTEEQRRQLIFLCNWKTENITMQLLEDLIEIFDENRLLFDPDRPSLKHRMRSQVEFVMDFPSNKIMEMQLNEYVVGKRDPTTQNINKRTFCYQLEFGMPEFGSVGGRSSRKFGIHFNRQSQAYDYYKKIHTSPQEAFDKIKSKIYKTIEAGVSIPFREK